MTLLRSIMFLSIFIISGHKVFPQSGMKFYLESIMPTEEKIEKFIGKGQYINGYNPNGGWIFNAQLGWILEDAVRVDGMCQSATFYHYEESGARKKINFPDQKARIQAYGNSFTHCDQVNDGETWEEYLAAHIFEPIENFGIGGYSVYQAFLRIKKIQETNPSKFIILNIWDDDHFRNLDSWWSIRNSKWGFCSFTMPHVRVNIEKNSITEIPNLCQKPEDVYKLRDINWLIENFQDDPVLELMLALRAEDSLRNLFRIAAYTNFGISNCKSDTSNFHDDMRKTHTTAAVFSTIKILEKLKCYTESNNKELFIILSYSSGNVKKYLLGEECFDLDLLNYLKRQKYPYVDLRQAHMEEFKTCNLSVDEYLSKYFIGHYAPPGNFFTAMTIKNEIIKWLDPKPKPYRK